MSSGLKRLILGSLTSRRKPGRTRASCRARLARPPPGPYQIELGYYAGATFEERELTVLMH